MTPWFSKLREQATERFERQKELRKAKKAGREAIDKYRTENIEKEEKTLVQKQEREKQLRKKTWEMEHPKTVHILKTSSAAGKTITGFAKDVVKEGAGTYKTGKTRLGKTKIRRTTRPSGGYGGYTPQYIQMNEDLSLTGGILRGEVGSGKNLMETNFFGEQQNKDRLNNIFAEKKDSPIYFGEHIGNNINKKNKTRYF
jgi:hypothetical protein